MAEVRRLSWRDRPWAAWITTLLVPLLTFTLVPSEVLFARHVGPGAFYAVLPWSVLCVVAALPLFWSLGVLLLDLRRFWRESGGGRPTRRALIQAGRDLLALRNLQGGGIDCDAGPARRWFHHLLVAGFLLCFAATLLATGYHHLLGVEAPYPMTSIPVIPGTLGGVGMVIGAVGLAWRKARTTPALDPAPGDYTLLALLFAIAATGLALLAFRETRAMGLLLATHLGLVAGFLGTLGQGKFAHAPYRAAALLRAAMDRDNAT
jgi:citrate/tricarballylate utilization protein